MPQSAKFNPFPGLRPFEASENHLFFGREEQVDDLIRRLGETHFLAVVGSSGSGKSSLVRAGLLPALAGGQLNRAGSDWQIAIFRPGSDPFGNLNHALGQAGEPGHPGDDVALHLREAVLRKSSLGLIEVLQQLSLSDSENLLVVVDQFEEIFRFARLRESSASDDAAAFVKLLLDCSHQGGNPIYVVITMRSDFIGDCARFEDLPEALNSSQYLVPRMTRDQRRAAIAGPVAVSGARISPGLLQQILNDVGSDPDQLPLMQHALMRTWEHWRVTAGGDGPLDLQDYLAVGSLANALSDHAEEAYAKLQNDRAQALSEKIFKCLTEIGSDGRQRRRPTTIRELCVVVDAGPDEVIPVINEFRAPDRSFLTPSLEKEPEPDTVIDISHESLIRNWKRLWSWSRAEAASAEMYRRLSDAASRYGLGTGGLWSHPELALGLRWRDENNPNGAWGRRYDENFGKTIEFLEESRQAHEARQRAEVQRREMKRRAAYRAAIISFAAVLVLSLLTVYALQQTRKTNVLSKQLSASAAILFSKQPGQEYEALAAAAKAIPDDFIEQEPQPQVLTALIDAISAARFSLPLIHPIDVRGGVFSPDGQHIATICEDGSTYLWETATGLLLGSWKGQHVAPGHWPAAPVFSPDSKLAVFTDPANKVFIVDTATGRMIRTIDAGPKTGFAGFAPEDVSDNGHALLLTVSFTGSATLWDTMNWERVRELQGPDYDQSPLPDSDHYAVFSSHGQLILVWGRKGDAQVLSVSTGEPLGKLRFHDRGITEAEISSDGTHVVTLDDGGTTRLFDISAIPAKGPAETKTVDACLAPRFAPGGDMFLCIQKQSIRLFGPGEQQHSLPEGKVDPKTPDLISASFSADGRYIVSASHDETARIWSTNSRQLLKTLSGHSDAVESAVFSGDNEKILTDSMDNAARIWNWKGYSFIQPQVLDVSGIPPSRIRAVAVSRDGQEIFIGRDGRASVGVWQPSVGGGFSEFPLPAECLNSNGEPARIDSIIASPAGDSLVTVGGRSLCLFDTRTKKLRYALPLNGFRARALFSPDGSRLLTIQDGTLKLWEAGTGTLIADAGGGQILDAVFLQGAGALFTVSRENWTEWDMRSGRLRRVRDVFPDGQHPETARFSPSSRYLVTNDPQNGLRMWTLNEKMQLYKQALGFWGPQTNFTFSPDETLVGGVRGHNAQLWPFFELDRQVMGLTFHTADVLNIIFSPPPQSLVVTTGADNLAWLWGRDGTGISALQGHAAPVGPAAFFPDGKKVVTGSEDGTVRIFPTDLRHLADQSACGICDLLQAKPEFHDLAECKRLTRQICASHK